LRTGWRASGALGGEVERGREGGREGQKSVRGIIRSYLATAILLCGYHRGARYSVVINNGDKGLLLHRFKQYLRRTMSRNYHCPFPTADYASSFNASLEYDRVANKWRINVSASRRCSAPRALSLSLSLSLCVCVRACACVCTVCSHLPESSHSI